MVEKEDKIWSLIAYFLSRLRLHSLRKVSFFSDELLAEAEKRQGNKTISRFRKLALSRFHNFK